MHTPHSTHAYTTDSHLSTETDNIQIQSCTQFQCLIEREVSTTLIQYTTHCEGVRGITNQPVTQWVAIIPWAGIINNIGQCQREVVMPTTGASQYTIHSQEETKPTSRDYTHSQEYKGNSVEGERLEKRLTMYNHVSIYSWCMLQCTIRNTKFVTFGWVIWIPFSRDTECIF